MSAAKRVESGCCLECGDRGRDCMSDGGPGSVSFTGPPRQKPLASPSPATRVCPLLKATRVRLSITSLLKDTFNYAPLSRDHFFRELCVSLACALRNGTTRSTCCFLPPIKGHVDRLRLLLVCAPLTHLEKDDEHGGRRRRRRRRMRRRRSGGVSKREKERERERERERS